MKLSISAVIAASLAASASAFVPSSTGPAALMRTGQSGNSIEGGKPGQLESALFAGRTDVFDGTLAGDAGFDPLGFAQSKEQLMKYREAEIKHARLAMLAAAGWPLSELFDRPIADVTDMEPVVGASDRAPSLLNGGLDKVPSSYWIGCIVLTAAIELYGLSRSNDESMFPGDFGFDPLGLYPSTDQGRAWYETAEIRNGRLAMLAITGFAFQEFVTGTAVVDQTPMFFKPMDNMMM